MKKLFLLILAVATLASCTKDESFYTEQDSEIKLAPVTSMATKANVTAAIDGTTYPKNENFDVYAYWKDVNAGADFTDGKPYLAGNGSGVEFVNKDKGKFWSGSVTYYWPKNGSLRFAAYSPSSVDMTHDQGTDTYTLANLVYPTNTNDTYEIMVAPTSLSYTAQTATENVSVVFEHALSWITFKVKSTEVAKDVFTVKNIVVNDVYNAGTLTADMMTDTKEWDYSGEANNYINVYYDKTATVGVEAATLENVKNGLLVLPQPTTSVTVVFDQAGVNGTPDIPNQKVTIPLVLDVENTPWEPGKHYTYTVIFDLDEILINPSVEDWEDVNVNDVPATEVVVANAQEFAEAVNNASQIRLVDDIVLNQNFYIYESLNIDLNGHTITCVVADEIAFRVYAGATLTIGRGDIVSDDYIVSVNAGGKLVMNEGNYTASTTVVNVNGGEAYITGGYFVDNSTYNGQYLLNHVDPQKDNGLIEITGGTFVNFNPAEASSEKPAMNFVKAGYNVISVENGANVEYTVKGAGEAVTLAADAVVYGSVSVNNNVFDGANFTLSAAAVPTDNGLIRPKGDVTVKNLTIDGKGLMQGENNLRGFYISDNGNYVIDNVKILGCGYSLNCGGEGAPASATLKVSNSVFESWTSYTSTMTAEFTSVQFTKGKYSTFRPYGTTVLTNCTFEEGFTIDITYLAEGKTIKFDNCKIGTTDITADNISTIATGYDAAKVIF